MVFGAFLLETVPSVLFILASFDHEPEEAIVRAINDTRDNDTIAAIVGAAVGALHGRSRLPERWIAGLAGRTRDNDDGEVFNLIRASETKWGPWASASLTSRILGGLWGVAVGDALRYRLNSAAEGSGARSSQRSAGLRHLQSAARHMVRLDTSLTLCTIDTLRTGEDYQALGRSFVRWLDGEI